MKELEDVTLANRAFSDFCLNDDGMVKARRLVHFSEHKLDIKERHKHLVMERFWKCFDMICATLGVTSEELELIMDPPFEREDLYDM